MGGTGLERPCKRGVFPRRGTHRASTNTLRERLPVDLPVVDQGMRVPVRGDQLRALTDPFTDVGPRRALRCRSEMRRCPSACGARCGTSPSRHALAIRHAQPVRGLPLRTERLSGRDPRVQVAGRQRHRTGRRAARPTGRVWSSIWRPGRARRAVTRPDHLGGPRRGSEPGGRPPLFALLAKESRSRR